MGNEDLPYWYKLKQVLVDGTYETKQNLWCLFGLGLQFQFTLTPVV